MNARQSPAPEPSWPVSHQLVINNELHCLQQVSDWLDKIVLRHRLDDDSRFSLKLCLTEALSNIINHGYQDRARHRIGITLSLHDDGLQLDICDDGVPFDPSQTAPVNQANTLDKAKIGGFGIHLIRSFVDSMRYTRRNDINHLTLSISAAAAAESA